MIFRISLILCIGILFSSAMASKTDADLMSDLVQKYQKVITDLKVDAEKGQKEPSKKPNNNSSQRHKKVLSPVSEVQELLNKLGYDAGLVDGVLNEKTKSAIKTFKRDNKMRVDGLITESLILKLRKALNIIQEDDGKAKVVKTEDHNSLDQPSELNQNKNYLDKMVNKLVGGNVLTEEEKRLCQTILYDDNDTGITNKFNDVIIHYVKAIKMAVIDPKNHGGWTFNHNILNQSGSTKDEIFKTIKHKLDTEKDPALMVAGVMLALDNEKVPFAVQTYLKLSQKSNFWTEYILKTIRDYYNKTITSKTFLSLVSDSFPSNKLKYLMHVKFQEVERMLLSAQKDELIGLRPPPKGEFETTKQHQDRMNKAKLLEPGIREEYQKKIAEAKAQIDNEILSFLEKSYEYEIEDSNLVLGSYNADEQIFPISIIIGNEYVQKHCNIPLEIAPKFKEGFNKIVAKVEAKLTKEAKWELLSVTLQNRETKETYACTD